MARFGAGIFDSLNRLRLPDLSSLLPATQRTAVASANLAPVHIHFGGETVKTLAGPDETGRLKEIERRRRFASHPRYAK